MEIEVLVNKTTLSHSVKKCDACKKPIQIGQQYNRLKLRYPTGLITLASRHYECACLVLQYCNSGEAKFNSMHEYDDADFFRWCNKQ